MPGGFTVRLSGDAEYEHKLEQLRLHLADLRGFCPLLVPLVHGWMGDMFRTEGEAGLGRRWEPLSPAYAAEKARRFPGRTILIREGGLRQAASRTRRDATPRTLTMTIESVMAPLHQEGTRRMPPRPLIPSHLPIAWGRDVDRAADEYVSVLIRRIGL